MYFCEIRFSEYELQTCAIIFQYLSKIEIRLILKKNLCINFKYALFIIT